MSDLIDREQAKDAIDKYLVGRNLETDGTFMARLINEIVIDRLPSADPTFDARDTQYNLPIGTDLISRAQAIDALKKDMASLDRIIKGMSANDVRLDAYVSQRNQVNYDIYTINNFPTAQPKRGKWILDRSGAYCCSECMEPCATYFMMKPRDKYCKMCGAKMEVME